MNMQWCNECTLLVMLIRDKYYPFPLMNVARYSFVINERL